MFLQLFLRSLRIFSILRWGAAKFLLKSLLKLVLFEKPKSLHTSWMLFSVLQSIYAASRIHISHFLNSHILDSICISKWSDATKINSKYIYCDAVYASDSPLGDFKLAKNNPFSYKPGGFIPGAGHGSTVKDAKGQLAYVNHAYKRQSYFCTPDWVVASRV